MSFHPTSSAEARPVYGWEEADPVFRPVYRAALVWALLLLDVLLGDGQRCASAGGGEVGRGPDVLAPQVFAHFGWVLLAQPAR